MFPNPYDKLDYAKSLQSSYIDQAIMDEIAREIKATKRQQKTKSSNSNMKSTGWLVRLIWFYRVKEKKAFQQL